MLYTLRIEKAGAAVLDGTTLLDLTAAGVTVDRTVSGEIVVSVPDGVAFGRLDPGAVLEATGAPSGRTFIAEQISVVSDGGTYPAGGGDIVERTTPLAGAFENIETILDLSVNDGLPSADRRIFMHDHAMAITTTVAGPHVLSVLIKPVEDADLEGPAVDGPGAMDSPAWLLGGNSNGLVETLGTNDAQDLAITTGGTVRARIVDATGSMQFTEKVGVGAAPPAQEGDVFLGLDGVLAMIETTTPAATAGVGKVYPQANNMLFFLDGAGVEHEIGGGTVFKSYTVTTQGVGTGLFYAAGYYFAPATDANLTQASTTVVLGSANAAQGAHVFVVAGGAGTASGGAGLVEIEVSGTSIDDAGVRTPGDTQVVVTDVTAMVLNGYNETPKKWIGLITLTLQNSGGATQTLFTADFNFGLAKYEDLGNRAFVLTDFEVTGLAGANDVGFNIQLLLHSSAGWTYSAAAFVPGGTEIVNMSTDYAPEDNLVNGENFAYKRSGLSTAVAGNGNQGLVVVYTTSTNNAIEFAEAHVGATF